jgi:2-polyprenyl-3-methyl-5-hydroxy-6-metoxy-1,4-benzoquinol methylase
VTRKADHYSYTMYADPAMARSFDDRRFGGPIGELIAAMQARVVGKMIGRVHGRTILDVGTGTGRAALMLAREGGRVTAVDASEEMLRVARGRAAGELVPVTFLRGDAHQLQFADRSFEVVVCLRVLMHAPDWERCLGELCRVADRLVIFDYPSATGLAAIEAAWRHVKQAAGRPTEAYRVFRTARIEQALRSSGFRVQAVHRQFVLPIQLHRLIGSRRFTEWSEGWLERAGLLRLAGSPVTVCAGRCES